MFFASSCVDYLEQQIIKQFFSSDLSLLLSDVYNLPKSGSNGKKIVSSTEFSRKIEVDKKCFSGNKSLHVFVFLSLSFSFS
tara:strand:+ start:254 stop:496 length:243 start_codon:yes stop_codon:yes gene_type:complete